MEIFIGLAVIVIILLGAIVMNSARLAAAVAAISSGVVRIGTEVTETTAAIRAHLEGDTGISQSVLLEQIEKLEAAGAALTQSGDALDSIQTELGGAGGDAEPIEDPVAPAPADVATIPAPNVDPAVTDNDASGDQPADGFGNQSGIGSDFEQGAGGDHIDLNSQSDTPADANGGEPANEQPVSDSDRPEDPGVR